MALKQVFVPFLGRRVKMGRKHPVARGPRLSFRRYIRPRALPTPPTTVDYSAPALSELNKIYLNDQLGDCVIAAGYHLVAVETGNGSGTPYAVSNAQLIADYSAIGGYDPNAPLVPDPDHPGQMINPTDQGCDEITALNYWCETGFADGANAVAWVAVDPADKTQLSLALYLFENLVFAMDLPDDWVNPAPSSGGFTWDAAGAPDSANGHAVVGMGYSAAGVKFDTWGMLGTLTWAAIAKYGAAANGGGVYAMLTPDELLTAQTKAPNGVDWSALIDDLNALGAGIPKVTSSKTFAGQVGSSATYQITATNSPTQFSASRLPAGLRVNAATGLISGTPTAASNSRFTVTATNGNGSGTQLVAATVKPAPTPVPAPAVTSPSAATATVGKPFNYKITATNHPTSFGATGIPGGLALNSSTGAITGTPTTAGTASVQITATNAGGTGSKTLTLTVKPAPTPTPPHTTHTPPHTTHTPPHTTHTPPHTTHTSTSGTPPTSGAPPFGIQSTWVPPPVYPVPPVPPPTPASLADLGRQLPDFGRQLMAGISGPRKIGIVAASGIVMQGLLTVLALTEDGGPAAGRG